MTAPVFRTIVVDRISQSGNPIATTTYNGAPILVYGGKAGEEVEVQLARDEGSIVGKIVDPTSEQQRRATKQRNRRLRRPERRGARRIPSASASSEPDRSMQELVENLGTQTYSQSESASRSRWGGYGEKNDGREIRRDVARRHR